MKISFLIFLCNSIIYVITMRRDIKVTNKTVAIDMEFTNNTVAHPGHCYSNKTEVGAMKKGESKTLRGRCIRAICEDDTTIYYDGCGKWRLPSYCKFSPGDLTKPYPDCCPYVDCYDYLNLV